MKHLAKSAHLKTVILMSGLIAIVMPSCATQLRDKSGHAIFKFERSGNHAGRIHKPRVVAINGAELPSGKQQVYLPAGKNKVKIRFNFPRDDAMDVNLAFKTRASQQYSVKFDLYPAHGGKRKFGDLASFHAREAAFLVLPFEIAYRVGAQGVHTTRQHAKKVKSAHIMVISSDQSEGVVEEVRVP